VRGAVVGTVGLSLRGKAAGCHSDMVGGFPWGEGPRCHQYSRPFEPRRVVELLGLLLPSSSLYGLGLFWR